MIDCCHSRLFPPHFFALPSSIFFSFSFFLSFLFFLFSVFFFHRKQRYGKHREDEKVNFSFARGKNEIQNGTASKPTITTRRKGNHHVNRTEGKQIAKGSFGNFFFVVVVVVAFLRVQLHDRTCVLKKKKEKKKKKKLMIRDIWYEISFKFNTLYSFPLFYFNYKFFDPSLFSPFCFYSLQTSFVGVFKSDTRYTFFANVEI